MFIGLAELIQVVIFTVSAIIIFKWFKSFGHCKYCEMTWTTVNGNVFGTANNNLLETQCYKIHMACINNNYMIELCSKDVLSGTVDAVGIKRCPVCGRKLK